ncbi:hypothetical protein DPMN_014076 [Dreissena polymorpha]|uniref:Uncharacterized protein n=1 Tax=Dreissena polymorpha TaxID=45954 RepID=A0A9D4S2D4_DREPO|nr:hypothetical protein DPMN_014076 [Dreissena polymorpha]
MTQFRTRLRYHCLTKFHEDLTINVASRVFTKQNVDDGQLTTDKRRSQKLTMSTLCSGELKTDCFSSQQVLHGQETHLSPNQKTGWRTLTIASTIASIEPPPTAELVTQRKSRLAK